MKIGMKRMVLVLVILSIGLTPLVSPAPGIKAIVTTNKRNYDLGEPVYFTLKNTGTTPIVSNVNDPWAICGLVGGEWLVSCVQPAIKPGWTLYPGQSKTWAWGQQQCASLVPAGIGIHRVEVRASGNTWWATFTIGDKDGDGLPDTVDWCPTSFGRIYNKGCSFKFLPPYPVIATSKQNYELGEPVVFTLTNTGTTAIGFGASSWEVDKLTGGSWIKIDLGFQPMILYYVGSGESRTWEWPQWSANPNLIIDAGIYRVLVYKTSSDVWSAIFTIGDKDSDGMPDTVDGCPDSFGYIYSNGCFIVVIIGNPQVGYVRA